MSCPPSESDVLPEVIACPHCGTLMNIEGLRPYAKVACPHCHEATHVHDQLGTYKIVGRIAQGGMSEIFEARDVVLDRIVALKILNETYSEQQERVLRFEQEAQIMAKVVHENIVKIYTVGRAYGSVFIAMELIDGHDLETTIKLKERPIPEAEALRLMIQTVDGLQAAWDVGVLHRDIKPANIIVDSHGKAKIVDFGLSLLQTQQDTEKELWVTPYYASPEALMRLPEDLRSDMYALGVTLFQILAGKPPFETIPTSTSALVNIKRNLPTLREVAPEVSVHTAQVVQKMMEFSADNRFSNYAELKEELVCALRILNKESKNLDSPMYKKRSALLRKARQKKMISVVGGVLVAVGAVTWGVIKLNEKPEPVHQTPPVATDVEPEEPMSAEMTREQVGELYKRAENQLRNNNIEGARSLYQALGEEESCPTTTRVWARLHVYLLSQILGNEAHAKVERSSLLEDIKKLDPGQVSSSVVQIASMLQKLNPDMPESQPSATEVSAENHMAALQLVGHGLNAWVQEHPDKALKYFKDLKELAKKDKTATMWLTSIEVYAKATEAIVKVQNMPEKQVSEFNAKKKAWENLSRQKSPTPGAHFTNLVRTLGLNLKRVESELASEIKKQEEAKKAATDEAKNQAVPEAEVPTPPEEDKILNKKLATCQSVLDQLAEDWDFAKAMEEWEYIRDNDSMFKQEARTLFAMGRLAERFLKNTVDGVHQVISAQRLVLVRMKDGSSCKLLSMKGDRMKVKPFDGDELELPLKNLTPEAMVRLHTNVLRSSDLDANEKLNRQFDAIAFSYLTGDKKLARSGADSLFRSSSTKVKRLERQWKAWMKILEK